MLAVVTGAAGFIGSSLVDGLLEQGWSVRGVDSYTAYYPRKLKEAAVAEARSRPAFEFVEADLRSVDLDPLLDGAAVVYHLAAQPGVRLSWADGFSTYDELNIAVTQRLLESSRRVRPGRFVFASSSSVYGRAPRWPTTEDEPTLPHSPYGVTKLAAEHLCRAYAENFGVHSISLRYFTVYGPRQRPDMAIHRMISAAVRQQPFPLYGDGSHVRDFTFVGDVVEANIRAATADVASGTSINIAGGASTTVRELIRLVESKAGSPIPIETHPAQPGDVERTGGSIDRARRLLGWQPAVSLAEGVARQVAWQRSNGQ